MGVSVVGQRSHARVSLVFLSYFISFFFTAFAPMMRSSSVLIRRDRKNIRAEALRLATFPTLAFSFPPSYLSFPTSLSDSSHPPHDFSCCLSLFGSSYAETLAFVTLNHWIHIIEKQKLYLDNLAKVS